MQNTYQNLDGTVGKALSLLDTVAQFHNPVRFNEILELSPYPKPSTYRLLRTLVSQRMVDYDSQTSCYSLGPRLIRMAHLAWQHASLAPIAAPYLDALSAKTGETIHLAKLDNGQVLYLDKRNANRPIPMFSDTGKIGPAYCTGVGKAMLANFDSETRDSLIAQQSFYRYTDHTLTNVIDLKNALDEIRQKGIALDNEEHEESIICIAVPILTDSNEVVGGISITGSTTRTDINSLYKYKDDLQETAQEIGQLASSWMLPKTGG